MQKSSTPKSPGTVRVMLVDDHPDRASLVEEHLSAAGFEVVAMIASAAGLLHQIEQHRPDVVLIDLESPDRDVLESLSIVSTHSPTAMIMFTPEDDPDYIRQAVAAGVSTYLTEAINPSHVKPIIDVAIAQFRNFQDMRAELNSVRSQLETRTVVEKAKGLLMQQKRISEDEAHQLLVRLAMDSNQKLATVARTVVATLCSMQTRK
ncbi:MAG: ANTAR domain-containing protein [Pseudomonadales bacterium]|nr:ANTAR domain-containing protein [Pseudomonadales bacterium]